MNSLLASHCILVVSFTGSFLKKTGSSSYFSQPHLCLLSLEQKLKNIYSQTYKDIKMKKLLLTIAALTIFTIFNQSYSQDKWSLELRPGTNYATQNISDADLGLGFGSEFNIAYRFMPHLAAYAGWSYNNFAVDQSFAGSDASFEETGYTFGFQFIHPIGESNLSYLVRIGGTYNHIEVENNDGDIIIDSGHGLGWQAEAGLVIPISEKFSIMPSVRYRSLNRNIDINNTSTSVDLNYLSVGVGLSWSF